MLQILLDVQVHIKNKLAQIESWRFCEKGEFRFSKQHLSSIRNHFQCANFQWCWWTWWNSLFEQNFFWTCYTNHKSCRRENQFVDEDRVSEFTEVRRQLQKQPKIPVIKTLLTSRSFKRFTNAQTFVILVGNSHQNHFSITKPKNPTTLYFEFFERKLQKCKVWKLIDVVWR